MSIPPNSTWRGCAASFSQPVNEGEDHGAQYLFEHVCYFNCHDTNSNMPRLPTIVYRSSSSELDIRRHVFRWDRTPYEQVFQNGFTRDRPEDTPYEIFFNLEQFVNHGGRPLHSTRDTNYAFISTTLNSDWYPTQDPGTDVIAYRYEIYAPGGIWVAQTLGDRYQYPAQDEVCFVTGIAPQYIRSAQRFRLSAETRHTRRQRVDDQIIINRNFNPNLSSGLRIQRPISYYFNENQMPVNLTTIDYPPRAFSDRERHKREIQQVSMATTDWYADNEANNESYINAAFRSSYRNEAYLFMMNEYVLVDYAPGTTEDKVVNGPHFICKGFPSLTGTAFGEHGIDCAFGSHHGDEAFIFSGNLCAQINYTPHTTNDKIIKGPMTITAMFPFFKGTVFESSVDAAFEATSKNEAYLFKDNQYALINYYGSDSHLIAIRPITQGFASLKNTIFETGIDAAFASHHTNEAFLFKGDSYALINFAPGTTGDYIIGGPKEILPNWPSLRTILPCTNHGLDVHDHHHTTPDADHGHGHDHDEL